MDVLRLDPDSAHLPWFPDIIIEGYKSMVWAERFGPAGEFMMTSHLSNSMRSLIPEGSFITLRDSKQVMLVETHTIEEDAETRVKQNVIRGRTVESFSEQRVFKGNSGLSKKMPQNYTLAQAISVILYNAFRNIHDNDIIYPDVPNMSVPVAFPDNLPSVLISDSSTLTGVVHKRFIEKPDYIYPTILAWLEAGKLGLRTVRPTGNTASIVTVSSTGVITHTTTADITDKLLFDIYNGTNRTHGQDIVPRVVFQHSAGHVERPQYLWTNKLIKSMVWGITSIGNQEYWDPDIPFGYPPTGFNRRIQLLDTGTNFVNLGDGVHWGSGEDYEAMSRALEDEFANHRDTFFFDSSIAENVPYKYGVDYFLGDTVTLQAEYGVNETMRVVEYTRTQDEQGERGYPTLVKV